MGGGELPVRSPLSLAVGGLAVGDLVVAELDGVLAGGPAGPLAEPDQRDEQCKAEGDDPDDHDPAFGFAKLAGGDFSRRWRRGVAADPRYAHPACFEVDGLFRTKRAGHGEIAS